MTLNEWIDYLARERDTNPYLGDAEVVVWAGWPKGSPAPLAAVTFACHGTDRWAIVESAKVGR